MRDMSQLQWESDLSRWIVEGMWIAALLLAVVYIPNFNWRESLPGKGFCILILAIVGALLKSVLTIWGVIHVTETTTGIQYGLWDEVFTWVSIGSLGLAGLAIVLLLIHTVKTLMSDPDHLLRKLGKKTHVGTHAGKLQCPPVFQMR